MQALIKQMAEYILKIAGKQSLTYIWSKETLWIKIDEVSEGSESLELSS